MAPTVLPTAGWPMWWPPATNPQHCTGLRQPPAIRGLYSQRHDPGALVLDKQRRLRTGRPRTVGGVNGVDAPETRRGRGVPEHRALQGLRADTCGCPRVSPYRHLPPRPAGSSTALRREPSGQPGSIVNHLIPLAPAVSYTHLRAHETDSYLVCRL